MREFMSDDLDKAFRAVFGWNETVSVYGAHSREGQIGTVVDVCLWLRNGYGAAGTAPSLQLNLDAFNQILRGGGFLKANEKITSIWHRTPMAEHLLAAEVEDVSTPDRNMTKITWRSAEQISLKEIFKEFPGITTTERGIREDADLPMIFEYVVSGPLELIQAFSEKYGRCWDGKEWVKG